jgi:hypothetical protein
MAPRRSTRTTKPVKYMDIGTGSYPDGAPETDLEQTIHSLNQEALSSQSYSAVDDVIVFSLFASKRRSRSYRSWATTATSGAVARNVTARDGIAITALCHSEISCDNPTRESCRRVAMHLQQLYPHLFYEDDISIVEQ